VRHPERTEDEFEDDYEFEEEELEIRGSALASV
jgi:hypothetical protein